MLGYGEIGARLGQTATSEAYKDWIDTYSGDEYQGVCTSVGELIDNALTARLGPDFMSLPRWQSLTQTFEKATVLEVGFWDMGLTP